MLLSPRIKQLFIDILSINITIMTQLSRDGEEEIRNKRTIIMKKALLVGLVALHFSAPLWADSGLNTHFLVGNEDLVHPAAVTKASDVFTKLLTVNTVIASFSYDF
tara:strand:+ start:2293 stop:2610 length:318 start_codon:yes stop_codon:yes gene_type:complete